MHRVQIAVLEERQRQLRPGGYGLPSAVSHPSILPLWGNGWNRPERTHAASRDRTALAHA